MANNTFDCGTNYLIPSGFKIIIDRKNFPSLQFYAQSVQHPDTNMIVSDLGYPRVGSVPIIGESLEFGTLTMDVLLDENMNSYRELYTWMESAVENKHQLPSSRLNSNVRPMYYDINVSILTSHNNVNRHFKYVNGFPYSIGSVNFAATDAESFLTFPVSFRFDYFEFS